MSRMKSVAHSFFWWPSLDKDIENLASHCTQCQELFRRPVTDVPHHWVYLTEAFERVYLDYAESEGSHYLLLVDSYCKWVDVFTMNRDCSTIRTVDCLLAFIGAHGILKTLASDNGPQFTSHAFKKFCLQNGICHKCTPPYHPESNGQVECVVHELKKSSIAKASDVSCATQV